MDAVNLVNNSTTNKRRELDFYPTPPEVTHALMMFLDDEGLLEEINTVWEPACGDGAMSKVIAEYVPEVISTDVRETGYGMGGKDYLSWSVPCGAIITNPPFNLSAEFIKKAIGEADVVAMVLKSQYWHASKRTELFREYPPAYVLAMNWRPDFKAEENLLAGKKGAPTMEVLWTIWIRGNEDTRYRILAKPAMNIR